MVKLYCHKHEPDNVESKSEFEIHIDIKDNTVVVFTEEILNGKLHFLCSVSCGWLLFS